MIETIEKAKHDIFSVTVRDLDDSTIKKALKKLRGKDPVSKPTLQSIVFKVEKGTKAGSYSEYKKPLLPTPNAKIGEHSIELHEKVQYLDGERDGEQLRKVNSPKYGNGLEKLYFNNGEFVRKKCEYDNGVEETERAGYWHDIKTTFDPKGPKKVSILAENVEYPDITKKANRRLKAIQFIDSARFMFGIRKDVMPLKERFHHQVRKSLNGVKFL